MKLNKIIKAYKEMEKLASNKGLTDQTQWDIYQLRKALRSHYEFQQERENALVEKYREFADENGNITGKPYLNYLKELKDLMEMDVEVDAYVIPTVPNVGIDFLVMEQLEDFINFVPA